MAKYILAIYVTLEQECAIKELFLHRNWTFVAKDISSFDVRIKEKIKHIDSADLLGPKDDERNTGTSSNVTSDKQLNTAPFDSSNAHRPYVTCVRKAQKEKDSELISKEAITSTKHEDIEEDVTPQMHNVTCSHHGKSSRSYTEEFSSRPSVTEFTIDPRFQDVESNFNGDIKFLKTTDKHNVSGPGSDNLSLPDRIASTNDTNAEACKESTTSKPQEVNDGSIQGNAGNKEKTNLTIDPPSVDLSCVKTEAEKSCDEDGVVDSRREDVDQVLTPSIERTKSRKDEMEQSHLSEAERNPMYVDIFRKDFKRVLSTSGECSQSQGEEANQICITSTQGSQMRVNLDIFRKEMEQVLKSSRKRSQVPEDQDNCCPEGDSESQRKTQYYCEECDRTFTKHTWFLNHKRDGKCRFECEYCGRVFLSKRWEDYKAHVNHHRRERVFKCHLCSKSYMNKRSLKEHMLEHSGVRNFACETCNLKFHTSGRLWIHNRKKHPERIDSHHCPVCNCTFESGALMNEHLASHQKDKPYHCNFCDQHFKRLGNLKVHMSKSHLKRLFIPAPTSTVNSSQEFSPAPGSSGPSSVGVSSDTSSTVDEAGQMKEEKEEDTEAKDQLETDMDDSQDGSNKTKKQHAVDERNEDDSSDTSVKEETMDSSCQSEIDSTNESWPSSYDLSQGTSLSFPGSQEQDQRSQDEQAGASKSGYYCEECGRTFVQQRWLKDHKRDGKCRFECSYCGKVFLSRRWDDYQTHLNHHNQERIHKCELCPKSYISKRSLKEHLLEHVGEKNYVCDLCGQRFLSAGRLWMHSKRWHPDENTSFDCEICGKSFKMSASLRDHMVVHTEERPYECEICLKKFKRRSEIRAHSRLHKPDYKCNPCGVCGKMFSTKFQMREHEKRHRKEYSVYCEVCGKGFYGKNFLADHMRTHSGEKPYECPICHYRCAFSGNLTKHMRCHNKEQNSE